MFALINRDLTDTGNRKAHVDIVSPGDLHPDKPYWVPVEIVETDTSTGPDKVVSPWVETVEVARLLRSRTIRDKTSGELDAEDTARADSLLADPGALRAVARMLHNINNRLRVIEGDTPLTLAQFKAAFKGLMR